MCLLCLLLHVTKYVVEFSVDPLTVTLKVGVALSVSKDLSNIVSR